jgi:hypothetical protein
MASIIIDRFESQWALLEDPERGTFTIHRDLLPKGVKEGDVLNSTIAIDREATEKRKKKIQGMVDDLKKSDQGGDIQL